MAGRRRSLVLQLQECVSPFSPACGNGTSPMSNLSNIMGGLTCEGSTPRRKLSLADDTPTVPLSRHSSQSSGVSMSSLDPDDPELDSLAEKPLNPSQRPPLRRFNSNPTSFSSPLFSQPVRPRHEPSPKKVPVTLESPPEDDEMVFISSASASGTCENPYLGPDTAEAGTSFTTVLAKREFKKPRPVSAPADLLFECKVQTTVPDDEDSVELRHSRLTSSNDQEEDEDDDDGFSELFDSDSQGSITDQQSSGISGLINNPIIEPSSMMSPPDSIPLQSMDCNSLDGTPEPKCRRGIFKVPSQPAIRRNSSLLKRPDRPRDTPSPVMKKKARSASIASPLGSNLNRGSKRNPLVRSHSTTDMDTRKKRIDQKLTWDAQGHNLTGDAAKGHLLPLVTGSHKDLKNISPETLSRLIQKEFASEVEEFFIVDSRYPYEFKGGHIKGAINLYTRENIDKFFLNHPMSSLHRRRIIVFHCEFSSQRAPSLLKYLRQEDRNANLENYPDLFYPEVYLLHGGYKNFFENCKELCEPQCYKPMLHQEHGDDLKHFKAKSKSWTGGSSRLGKRQKNLVF